MTIDILPAAFTRRAFCARAGGTTALAALGALLESCGGDSPTAPSSSAPSLPTINGSLANGIVSVSIDSSSPLATVGSAALVRASGREFLVSRTAQTSFTALTATCTHEGCTVTGFDGSTYVCPCHGSRFNTSGGVLNGPATAALRSFTTQFSNNVITFST